MKQPVLLALAALTRAVLSATDISELQDQLPDCSIECIAEGAAKFDCAITDISCQCSKMEEITQEVSPCLVNKGGCSFEEITGQLRSFFRWEISFLGNTDHCRHCIGRFADM